MSGGLVACIDTKKELMQLRDKIATMLNSVVLEGNEAQFSYCLGRLDMLNEILGMIRNSEESNND